MFKLKTFFPLLVSIFLLNNLEAQNLDGEIFRFKFSKGDALSYISTVQEEAFFNGQLNNKAQIINRISSSVLDTTKDGSGILQTSYMTTENSLINSLGKPLTWGEESVVVFTRMQNGTELISDKEFMPTVRNVPIFPDQKVKKGQHWSAQGKEVHDLRTLFNMTSPIIIPFDATYKYKEDCFIDGTRFCVISVDYSYSFKNSMQNRTRGSTLYSTQGFSKQILYWNPDKNILDHYEEEFQIEMTDIFGNSYLFRGTSQAEVTEFKTLNNQENAQKLQDSVDELQLENIQVKQGEKGLTISLENIQFDPDSNILLESEKIKLEKIGELIKGFSNDLLITGHTADRGTANGRKALSEARAQSVAEYLDYLGIRDKKHIFTEGKGALEPIASNSTEEGRAKNRRVEITILDR